MFICISLTCVGFLLVFFFLLGQYFSLFIVIFSFLLLPFIDCFYEYFLFCFFSPNQFVGKVKFFFHLSKFFLFCNLLEKNEVGRKNNSFSKDKTDKGKERGGR